jgi:hypothetical protein
MRLIHVYLITLLSVFLVSSMKAFSAPAASAPVRSSSPRGFVNRTPLFPDYHTPLPKGITQRTVSTGAGRASAIVPPSTVDLTPGTAAIDDKCPSWGSDDQTIVFQSNRVLASNGTPASLPGTNYHIYKMNAQGLGVTALTGPSAVSTAVQNATSTSSQTEPNLSHGLNSVAYIDTSAAGVDIKVLDLIQNVVTSVLTSNLLSNTGQQVVFTAVNHPEFAGDPNTIIFAGKPQGDTHFHIYEAQIPINGGATNLIQFTSGVADDLNPTMNSDPNHPMIAFDSNRSNAQGTGVGANRNIWVMNTAAPSGVNPVPIGAMQVTNFTGSDNIEPSWSTVKIDQVHSNQGIVNGQQLLAFASTRQDNNTGNHGIWWLKTTVSSNNGVLVVPPESTTNTAYQLTTNNTNYQFDDRRPSWPQFISTYRIAYYSNRSAYDPGSQNSIPSTANDVFASTLIDVNAPTLIRWDSTSGEIVHVDPRLGTPGQNVTISVKIADFESGVKAVYVQIKNPDGASRSSDGHGHKCYNTYTGQTDGNWQHDISGIPTEYEWEPIDTNTDTYSGSGQPAPPIYYPGYDDQYAFSGSGNPVDPRWLQLNLVGTDPVTGVSTYSNTWKTDINPSDYYIDVIAYDNALSPFPLGNGWGASNWMIYDNVWGFSTKPFNPSHNILFVNDYACGQKFMNSAALNGPLGHPSTGSAGYSGNFLRFGTESWMTESDRRQFPTQYADNTVNPAKIYPVRGDYINSLGVGSYDDQFIVSDGTNVPPTQQYDQWRILCRGPLPYAVALQYMAHNEQQPPDIISGETVPRNVDVSPACIIWQSPYSGEVFAGPGTITDLATQQLLHNFLMAGGRLFVNGQDVAWALTLGGASTNSFLTNDLQAQYASTNTLDNAITVTPTPAAPYEPISFTPWGGHYYPGALGSISNITDNPLTLGYYDPTYPHPPYWSCPAIYFVDQVIPGQGAVADITYPGGNAAMMHYYDKTTGHKIVYCSAGLEGINSDGVVEIDPATGNVIDMLIKNRRAELMHNIVCWLRTGIMAGKVFDLKVGTPIAGAFVRLFGGPNQGTSTAAAYTGITGTDGSYTINGVEAGTYDAVASKAGYSSQRVIGVSVHGGYRAQIADVRLTNAQPASISGQITLTDGVTPVQGATITATEVVTGGATTTNIFTAQSDSKGNYTIMTVAAGTIYTVTVTPPANSSLGASVPVSLPCPNPQDPNTSQRDQVVQPAKTYTGFNFEFRAQPGTLIGRVLNGSVTPNTPIQGATVTATKGTQVVTTTTDANGNYRYDPTSTTPNGLDPGVWSLSAVAPGFAASTAINATVTSNQTTTNPDILLNTVPPGIVVGLVIRANDSSPLPGVTVVATDSTGKQAASTTTGATQTAADGSTYNYSLGTLPAGVSYTISASEPGYTAVPASVTVPVVTGQTKTGVNFSMNPLFVFTSGTSLVSSPYDYPSGNIYSMLALPQSDQTNGRFIFATWSQGNYFFAPNAPATTFRLGQGYFLVYPNTLPLSVQGTPAPPTQQYMITLNKGWNLIGDPFLISLDFTKTQYQDPITHVIENYIQAITNGDVGSGLYSYNGSSLDLSYTIDPWVGYWLYSYKNQTLILDPAAAGLTSIASKAASVSRAAVNDGTGWTLNLKASAGDAADTANRLGISSHATDGYDSYKILKPPVFGSRYINMAFSHDNWGDKSGEYGVDIRSASVGSKTWDFNVQTNIANTTANLTWPNSATLSRKVTLTLYDLSNGQSVDLRSSGSYSWQTGSQPATRAFRIVSSSITGNSLLKVSNIMANQPGGRASGININFNLSDSANVQIRILDASGKMVRTVLNSVSRAAGINQVIWDQKNDQGVSLPMGVYMVDIHAQSTDGKQTARGTAPILITR